MYRDHFGLTLSPFSNTPDPRFFYETSDHEEALASLLYVARERKGFALVTGEVGTGKTLLTRMALTRMPAGTRTAMITHTSVTGIELLRSICTEFNMTVPDDASAPVIIQLLEDFLLEQYARDRRAVVLLDEAQNLPPDAFEQLRLLGNLEAEDAKLLQVLILGQPELMKVLARENMRQLRQRIYRTYNLRGFSAEGTTEYIMHRLRVAGAGDREIFTLEACKAVHTHAKGLPRLINQICDNALLNVYSDGGKTVSAAIVHEVADHIPACCEPAQAEDESEDTPRRRRVTRDDPTLGEQIVDNTRTQQMESLLRDMTQRQQDTERRLAELARFAGPAGDPRDSAHAHLEESRALREDAKRILSESQDYAGQSRKQLGRMIDQVRRDAETLRREIETCAESAGQELSANGASAAELSERLQRLYPSIRNDIQTLVSTHTKETASLRAEVHELRKAFAEQRADTERRTQSLRDLMQGRLTDVAVQISDDQSREEEAVRLFAERLDALTEAACERIADTQTGYLKTVTAAQQELESARGDIGQWRDESAATVRDSGHLFERMQTLFGDFKVSADKVAQDVRDAAERASREIDGHGREAAAETTRAAQALAAQLSEEREQARAIQEKLDQTMRHSQSRLEQWQDAVAGVQEKHERHLRDLETSTNAIKEMQVEATETLEKARRQLSDIRTDAQTALDQAARSARRELAEATARLAALTAETNDSQADGAEAAVTITQVRNAVDGLRSELAEAMKTATDAVERLETRIGRGTGDAQSLYERIESAGRRMAAAAETHSLKIGEVAAQAATQAGSARRGLEQAVGEATMMLTRTREEARNHLDALETRLATLFGEGVDDAGERRDDLTASDGSPRTDIAGARREVRRIAEALDKAVADASDTTETLKRDLAIVETRQATIRDDARTSTDALTEISMRLEASMADARQRVEKMLGGLETRIADTRLATDDLADRIDASFNAAADAAEQIRETWSVQQQRIDEAMSVFEERGRMIQQRGDMALGALESRARETIADLGRRIESITEDADERIGAAGRSISVLADRATTESDAMSQQVAAMRDEFQQTLEATRNQAAESVARAEATIRTVRDTARDTQGKLSQAMNEFAARSADIRDDLTTVGEALRDRRDEAVGAIRAAAEHATTELETLTRTARADAHENHERLTAICTRAEGSAEEIRRNAAQMLRDVQAGANELREHTDALLQRAREGAENLGAQSASVLEEAQATAERFREQAEHLLEHAEKTSAALTKQVDDVRSDLKRDVDVMQSQVATATAESRAAANQSGELLAHAHTVQERTAKLLTLPQEILGEANERTKQLKTMSDTLRTAVARLGQASQQSEQRASQLAAASTSADRKMKELGDQTMRVTQLVGSLRQMYTNMDNRIGQLRQRLDLASEIATSVPGQLSGLREALRVTDDESLTGGYDASWGTPANGGATGTTSGRAASATIARPRTTTPARPAATGSATTTAPAPTATPVRHQTKPAPAGQFAKSATPSAAPARRQPTAAVTQPATTGETLERIAANNARLNQWLQKQIREASGKSAPTSDAKSE